MLKIVGDISLTDGYFDVGFGVGSQLAKGYNPFHWVNRKEGDLWIGNFEGVASETTDNTGRAGQQFCVNPCSIRNLHHMNVYGFANNHAMQHGKDAYLQTVSALESHGAKCFGMNNSRSVTLNHHGQLISLVGFSQRIDAWSKEPLYWHNPEYEEIENEVGKLPEQAFKIAYTHWGNEFINYPSSQQKKFAHWLVDIGFDLVIGMHPHVLQGFEVYKGKYIFYSIGNFVFDMAWEPTRYGAIVTVDISNTVSVTYDYIKIGRDFSPRVIAENEVPVAYRFDELNKLIGKEENSEEYHLAINHYYKQYRKANHKDILCKMLLHPKSAVGTVKDFIVRRF